MKLTTSTHRENPSSFDIQEDKDESSSLPKRMKLADEQTKDAGENIRLLRSPITTPMLLPENWLQILTGLPIPDFIKVINIFVEWSEIVHSQKVDRFLPLVLPLVLEYLPLKSILQCRLVNKSVFKRVVDSALAQDSVELTNLFEHDPSHLDGVNSIRSKVKDLESRFNFQGRTAIYRFLSKSNHRSLKGGNPFLTGKVSFHFGQLQINDTPLIRDTMSQVLTSFGIYITSLDIIFHHLSETELVMNPSSLYVFLGYLPNLKHLSLTGVIPNNKVPLFNPRLPPRIPLLAHLVSLDVSLFQSSNNINDFDLIRPFLLFYGAQLQVLRCTGCLMTSQSSKKRPLVVPGKVHQGWDVLDFLPALTHLKIDAVQNSLIETLLEGWQRCYNLKMLRLANFPLPYLSYYEGVNFWHLVRVIKIFQNSLTVLELMVLSVTGFRDEREGRVEGMCFLSQLKKLTTYFKNVRDEWFLEFLRQSCPYVEELHFQVLPDALYSMEDSVEVKNAFRVLRKLRKIVIWFRDRPKYVIRR